MKSSIRKLVNEVDIKNDNISDLGDEIANLTDNIHLLKRKVLPNTSIGIPLLHEYMIHE